METACNRCNSDLPNACVVYSTQRRAIQFLEKYTSHFIERVVCERELETEQNCNILTPTLMAISVSFLFSWAAQPGAWGPASLGAGFLIFTRLIPKLNRGSRGPLLPGAVFSTASFLQLSDLQTA